MSVNNKPIELEEAVAKIREQICRITDTENCPLEAAAGRILAEDITAPIDQPPFPRSPYDGYAIRSIDSKEAGPDKPVALAVVGEVDAGGWFGRTLAEGQAVRIMTGAPIPEGADAVIRQ
ncbi:MAG: molybdopterin molybdenumtransferase MoeA, partial [Spirochaetales bacterium]|nr:molybdopterin molybdenumtransferase MoeA [Spirochaetales bacterium]